MPISLGQEKETRKVSETPWNNVSDALTNAISEGLGAREEDKDLESKRMLSDSIYILRGFGLFEVGLGAGVTGKTLTATLRRSSNNDKEVFRDAYIKCPINNRICQAAATLRFGAKKLTVDDEQAALLSDFGSVSSTVLEDWTLTDEKLERRLTSPNTLHAFSKAVTNQINFFGLIFGNEHRNERFAALKFLIEIHEDTPELFSVDFLNHVWEQLNFDFFEKTQEGARRLRQHVGKHANQTEIRRVGLTSNADGKTLWTYPKTFEMESEKGYWQRVIVPKMDEAVEKDGFLAARDRILGKTKKVNDSVAEAPKRRARRGSRTSSTEVGRTETVVPSTEESEKLRMYPAGNKLTKGEKNLAYAHAPRNAAGKAFCWDFNAHGGCPYENKCYNSHELMQNRNIHWSVRAEICRRGGFRNEKRIPPGDIDGMVRSLREANVKIEGVQTKRTGEKETHVGSCTLTDTPTEGPMEPPGLQKRNNGTTWVGKPPTVQQEEDGIHGILGIQKEEEISEHRNRNKSLPGAPEDFILFDFSEMEKLGNSLFNAQDKWVHQTTQIPRFHYSSVLTVDQQEIDKWWEEYQPTIAEEIQTFVKNRMVLMDKEEDLERRLLEALTFLRDNGTSRDSQLAASSLLSVEQIMEEKRLVTDRQVGKRKSSIFCGPVFQMEDCSSQDVRIGNLHFLVVDYGDQLRLTEGLQKGLNTGDVLERNQCAILAYAAGVEWKSQGCPNRHPGRKRVALVATQIREQEYRRAVEAQNEVLRWSDSGFKFEIESVIHEPTSYAHERDLRTLSMFLFQSEDKVQIRVIELTDNGTSVAHTYPHEETSVVVYLIACAGHLRWAKPSPVTHPKTWKEWKQEFDEVIHHPHVEIKREESREAKEQSHMWRFPCKHCKQIIKTKLSALTIGNLTPVEEELEDDHGKSVGSGPGTENIGRIEPSPSITPPVQPCTNTTKTNGNDQIPISSHLRDTKEDVEYEPTMEELGKNWRRGLTILPQTLTYLEAVRDPFTDDRVEYVAECGSNLVKAAGGFVEAGKQIQEIRMRKLRPNLEFIEEYGYLYPAIHDPVCEIFTTGANPLLKHVLPANTGKDEKPHDEKLTPLILQTLWEDVQDGSLFLCHRNSIPTNEFIAASSTGAVPKKNPDRTISSKVRIISDLRRVNLSLHKTEVFPVMTPSIEQICTRITLLKRLFPSVKIELAKRDIARF